MEERKQRTEISSMGEFGLINHLTENLPAPNASTCKGIGDDAAVLDYSSNKRTLVTTDLLLEGVHFDLTYTPLKHLGYKAAVVNFSDIYAMNGTPRQITVSLGISKKFAVEDVDELYAGIRIACEHYGVDIVGGDTSASLTGLSISITCIGEAEPDKIVYRNGAGSTDLICVSGNLGAAYMGLLLLEREKDVYAQTQVQPDFASKEYIIERQLKPEARRDIVEALDRIHVVPTSMMDISDGLSSELLHICKQSNTGCRIYEERIPIDYQTAVMAEEVNMNVTTVALHGGEDYELLFTVPLKMNDVFQNLPGIKVIGHMTDASLGCNLICRDGQEFELRAQGWNAFTKTEDENAESKKADGNETDNSATDNKK
jgi:thiamine-monophosphate kinase